MKFRNVLSLSALALAASAPTATRAATLAAALAAPLAAPLDGYVSYSSVARDRHSTDELYGERHVLLYRDGHIAERAVLYTCKNGTAFAHKWVTYANPLLPNFVFEDASNGMREGIRADATSGGRVVFYRERAGAPEKSAPLPAVAGLVADAGFDEFVQSRWDDLLSGKTLELHFLLPSRLTDYSFQVQRLRAQSVQGSPAEVFRLRLSGIWGWFLPGIDVYYRSSDHLLLRYDGLSDLHDAAGNNYKTLIDFPLETRRVSTAQAMLDARSAPIAACATTP